MTSTALLLLRPSLPAEQVNKETVTKIVKTKTKVSNKKKRASHDQNVQKQVSEYCQGRGLLLERKLVQCFEHKNDIFYYMMLHVDVVSECTQKTFQFGR